MKMNYYLQGTLVNLGVTFLQNEVPIDPTNIFLEIDFPDGTNVTYQYGIGMEIVKTDTGTYYSFFDTTNWTGEIYYKWYSTGFGQSVNQGMFFINTIM